MGIDVLSRASFLLLCISCLSVQCPAQKQIGSGPSPSAEHRLTFDVVVTNKAGKAVDGLTEKDFTVLTKGVRKTFSPSMPPAE